MLNTSYDEERVGGFDCGVKVEENVAGLKDWSELD